MDHRLLLPLTIFLMLSSCSPKEENPENSIQPKETVVVKKDTFKIYTPPSTLRNKSVNFNSPAAINIIAEIENEYFNNYLSGESKYYGTQWYFGAINVIRDSVSEFESYMSSLKQKGVKADSMHCTLYGMKAMEAGFGKQFHEFEKYHEKFWKKDDYAGWSVAYILTEYYGWKAYLFITPYSREYNYCLNNFKKDKKYQVWYQPDIPIEKIFRMDTEQAAIDELLKKHEFGWGFSEQGWHTWITRFTELKECNWLGAPSSKYDVPGRKPLFITTKFTDYSDYHSHVIVFPPENRE